MGRTPEEPLPVDETYRDLLRAAVKAAGGQPIVAELADVNQGTISRTLTPGARATYTTLAKLSRVLPAVPSPIVAIRDAEHETWCRLGALLAEHDPEQFAYLLRQARRDVESLGLNQSITPSTPHPAPEAVRTLKSVIAHPLPRRPRKNDRGG
jgi:hypothetical protein